MGRCTRRGRNGAEIIIDVDIFIVPSAGGFGSKFTSKCSPNSELRGLGEFIIAIALPGTPCMSAACAAIYACTLLTASFFGSPMGSFGGK